MGVVGLGYKVCSDALSTPSIQFSASGRPEFTSFDLRQKSAINVGNEKRAEALLMGRIIWL